jgi:hypothetical protein
MSLDARHWVLNVLSDFYRLRDVAQPIRISAISRLLSSNMIMWSLPVSCLWITPCLENPVVQTEWVFRAVRALAKEKGVGRPLTRAPPARRTANEE